MKKHFTLLFAGVLAVAPAIATFGQDKAKEARWEGRVERISKDHSSLTVRKSGGGTEMTCATDSSTKWVSQYHADKKVNDIDASQVKEGDYVICEGTSGKGGVINATMVSKRLSHSPQQ